ncbi:hypothetical protein JW890_08275 [candidate division WOR-3 bacterium]|nr:hypothetical protein [candidate division WOR-3 bacterium]
MIKKLLFIILIWVSTAAFCDDSCWLNTYRFTDIEIVPQHDSVIGRAMEDFICLISTDTIRLDCVSPVADSVKVDNVERFYYQTDSLLVIYLGRSYAVSETLSLDIFYRAVPVPIPTPFASGGIFIDPTLIFSCHAPFGLKTWVPCLDDHRHKAAVRQYYTVPDNLWVVSNGILDSVIQLSGNRKKFFWRETEYLSPYLQGLAASSYSLRNYSVGGIPVLLAAYPQDSAKLSNDLSRLSDMLTVFENRYGSYPFAKIAYAEVSLPGAMENQNSILVGSSVITGTGTYEILFAHELSHMWWGDYVTTDSKKEVWFNEGLATFSEGIFVEHVSGQPAMHNYMRGVRNSYISWENTNGIYPMYDPPWQHYYSDLTYERPASVFYALRFMLGDSLFFGSLREIVAAFGGSTVTWQDIDTVFSGYCGENLTWFFQQWVFGSGTPQMSWTAFKKQGSQDSLLVRVWTHSNSSTDFVVKSPLFVFSSGDTLYFRATAQGDTSDNFYQVAADSVSLDPYKTQFTSSTEKVDVEINLLLSLNESIMLYWSSSTLPDILGYDVYGAQYGSTSYQKLNTSLLTDTFFLAEDLTNGQKYTFYVTYSIQGDWESFPSDTASASPVSFPFDRRILLVDESEGGNGSQTIMPTNAQIDSAYASLMTGIAHDVFHCDSFLPDLSLLGHYQCVFWHSDEYTSTSQIKDEAALIRSYLTAGGKIIISGWRVFEGADPSFLALFDISHAEVVTLKNFETSEGKNGFTDISVNSSLMLPSWNGKMDRATYFTAAGADTLGVWGPGYPQSGNFTTLGENDSLNFVVNGYPLYFMEHGEARDFILDCFTYLGQVGIEENPHPEDQNSLPFLRQVAGGIEIFLSPLPGKGELSLMVYDVTGRKVFDMTYGFSERIFYSWKDSEGASLPVGNYFLSVEFGERRILGKYFNVR